jgi:hypothetical protein
VGEIGREVRLRQRVRVADVLGIIRNSHNLDSGPGNCSDSNIRLLSRAYHEYESYDCAVGDIDTSIQHTHMAVVAASEPPYRRNSMQ